MKNITKKQAEEINQRFFDTYQHKEVLVRFGNKSFSEITFQGFTTYRLTDLTIPLAKRVDGDGKEYNPKLVALNFDVGPIIIPYEDIESIIPLIDKVIIRVVTFGNIVMELV